MKLFKIDGELLEVKCWECGGYGEISWIDEQGIAKEILCPHCEGRGTLLTGFGRELIEFIRKYL